VTTTQTATSSVTAQQAQERADLLQSLAQHRFFLRFTADGLTDEQARERPTVSALSVGGLIAHVADMERGWVAFIEHGAAAFEAEAAQWSDDSGALDRADGFPLPEGQTLADVLATYERVAARTEEVVRAIPDLDAAHALPSAPWFEPGATWTARRVLLHLVAETAQHAGHADIIRETLDGHTTMA